MAVGGKRRRKRLKPPDYTILAVVLALLTIGLVTVFSASSVEAGVDFGDPYYYFKRQLAWMLLGFVGMTLLALWPYAAWKPLAPLILGGAILLLVLVAIPGIGISGGGARRWLGFGSLTFQPSEAAKLAMVLFLAAWLDQMGRRIHSFRSGILPFTAVVAVIAALIMLQPDLGTAVAIAGTAGIMLFAAGARFFHLFGLAAMAAPAVGALIYLEEYRLHRFLAFLDPFADPLGAGYHIIQALYALGSGGLFGVGLGNSRQKFFYLPERHTDFIFAILGEELGLLGTLSVLFLFAFLTWRGLRLATLAPDRFSALLAVGVTGMIALQATINIGVVTSSMPITGIPLPFISFGGSSLVFTMAGIGLLMNISRHARDA